MITNHERINQPETPFLVMQAAISSGLYVALPCIIQSFNADAVTVTAQPAIRWKVTNSEGKTESVALPLLVDVPVIFPRGGGVTLTFPVKAGDECLVIFADRCIDYWWQNGGVQEPVDPRQHNLSDGFAIVGPQSQAKKISGISTSAAQLRTDDGAAYIELSPGSHNITVKTPGKLTATADGGTEITSPEIVLNGNVTINGNLSQGMGASGGMATMNGPINVKNDVIAGGVSQMKHKHGGVETGGGTTGVPQ
ncbi:Gp138 family membrane-puncturing spike protein [Xenorhabdus bovienii]|uniref:Gp138 family membrane-puncturing spike protein n=3 Tax=Xenorhabdus bovienii TaxID=40576 RepID=UPI00237D074A|nr:Gp138 family membrane-puncturing spike protein [Xenorhabdus bovienii]MDE1483456.1 translation initiation factor IF-2 [Xenorhabdus bovienii]MDE9538143.1 translation initiation factor IF-2 [Xenorhabdus bovienii]